MAFVSSSNNNSTNGAINTAQVINTALRVSTSCTQVNTANIENLSDVVIYAFLASQPSSHQLVNEDLEQIHPDDLEEMDLKWQMAMLTIRARRFLKKTGRKLTVNDNETIRQLKKGLGYANYNAVLPPYTGNFMPPKLDLSLTGLDEFANKPVVENFNAKTSKTKPKDVRKNNDALIIVE
nr:putative zinc finger, CCHC-type [Tanacetum cinerariifolium]